MQLNEESVSILSSLNEIFREELDNPQLFISICTSRDSLQTWDSLAHVRIISSIEQRFGIQFNLAQIEDANSVSALLDVIVANQA
jgi:acyl carrier protein